MSNTRKLTMGFSGGEVTNEFWGQIGDAKFQTGLATCRNMVVLPHGPVANRSGTAFVRAVKTPAKRTRLIPFTYSTTQTMVLEFGHQYVRFHTQGATLLSAGAPYEVATPYLETDLFDIHFVQSADVLTLAHPNHAPRELRRLGATSWTLVVINFGPVLAPPANIKVASNEKGTDYTYRYVVTATDSAGVGMESAASLESMGVSSFALVAATNASPGAFTFSGDLRTNLAAGTAVQFAAVGGMVEVNSVPYTIGTVSYSGPGIDSSGAIPVATDGSTIVTLLAAGVAVNTTAFGVFTTGGTMAASYSGVKNNLFITGGRNDITWDAVAGAARYDIYKFTGGLFGYIGQSSITSFTDDNITPNLGKTPRVAENPFSGAGNYPGAVSYFEQRRCFAGSINEPQNLRMTRSGTESDLSYSLPIRDDDRINVRVAAREANTIRHIVPLANLVLLTAAAEWRVTSINSDAITPNSISVKPQSYIGANNVQPVIVNNNIIFVASRGGHLREMTYSQQANNFSGGYLNGDLSLRAPHLFDGLDIVDMAYAKAPFPMVWAVSSNGKLLGLTYVPEQQVGALHQHDTDGLFESCCVVAEGSEDVLYVVVNRTVNGAQTRYVERMRTRLFAAPADAFFVDAGATYEGAPATVISGLSWLEGKTVSVLGDGAVFPRAVVTGGAITLDQPCSKVQVGLPITADAQTLPLSAQIDASFGQGRVKNINKVWLRVYKSSGVFAGPSLDRLVQFKQRTTEPYGSAPSLRTDEVEITLEPSWQAGGQIYVRQSDPLPLTLVSMTVEAALGG